MPAQALQINPMSKHYMRSAGKQPASSTSFSCTFCGLSTQNQITPGRQPNSLEKRQQADVALDYEDFLKKRLCSILLS